MDYGLIKDYKKLAKNIINNIYYLTTCFLVSIELNCLIYDDIGENNLLHLYVINLILYKFSYNSIIQNIHHYKKVKESIFIANYLIINLVIVLNGAVILTFESNRILKYIVIIDIMISGCMSMFTWGVLFVLLFIFYPIIKRHKLIELKERRQIIH